MINSSLSVYINWAAYDELSDKVELTEELAMTEMDALLRLREQGVQFDAYIMDCFWYAPDGGYRTWRRPNWPNGPDAWLERCRENGILSGLWLASDMASRMDSVPDWEDSYGRGKWAMSSFTGGFLPHFLETMDIWYGRGVRLFKFDFAQFTAAPSALEENLLPSEIRAANITAFRGALKAFRVTHPEVILLAYNGFNEGDLMSATDRPVIQGVDTRWLEAFDSLYCGDPRLADVPAMNFWRSKDIYSDHMVRVYERNHIPLSRIDNTAFMIGTTGTCYGRGKAAWKGMLILSLARGGWMNTYYGNLELLDTEDAKWFAQAQSLFYPLQASAIFSTFGPMPGEGLPYGFSALRGISGVVTLVNPSQAIVEVEIPSSAPLRLLFTDAGFTPEIVDRRVTLGPEQMALIGLGDYADSHYDLGIQEDVLIPRTIQPLEAHCEAINSKSIRLTLSPPHEGDLRVIFRQTEADGQARRTTGGSLPDGVTLGNILKIAAMQGDRPIPVSIHYDKAIWSGLSWAVGEVNGSALDASQPLIIEFSTAEEAPVILTGEVYEVVY